MRGIAIFFFILINYSASFAQEPGQVAKQADIKITQFTYNGFRMRLACDIELRNLYSVPGRYLIFFIKKEGDVINTIFQNDNDQSTIFSLESELRSSYNFSLSMPKSLYNSREFILYPVIIQGDLASLKRTIPLVNTEFYEIEKILEILYKAKLNPLTYAKFKYPRSN
jgi:hypothetical protein